MLSTVLRSQRAVHLNIAIVRAFVQLCSILATHEDQRRKITQLEKRYAAKFHADLATLRQMLQTRFRQNARSDFASAPTLPRTPSNRHRHAQVNENKYFNYSQRFSANLSKYPISSRI